MSASSDLIPFTTNSTRTHNLGTSAFKWSNLYLKGNLSDGTNSITIANLAARRYTHNITLGRADASGTLRCTLQITNNSSAAMTMADLAVLLGTLGFNDNTTLYPASGALIGATGGAQTVLGVYKYSDTAVRVVSCYGRDASYDPQLNELNATSGVLSDIVY